MNFSRQTVFAAALASLLTIAARPHALLHQAAAEPVIVTVHNRQSVNTFRPDEALGAGVDGLERGDVAAVYTPANIAAMRSAGLKPLIYRLRTELGVEVWHWNPQGAFSDVAAGQGYWTSNARAGSAVLLSNGYQLPRRGSTSDQANDRSYSRIDDGDPKTFWKSNPYLDRRYTNEDNRLHPQWLLIDFGRREPVNAVRIAWGDPYASAYRVEYWRGKDPGDPQELPEHSGWALFPMGAVRDGQGLDEVRRVCGRPIQARWIRVLMTESEARAAGPVADPRDRLGFAVREIYAGTIDATGRLHDAVRHFKSARRQTRLFASSTDPWHRREDLDPNVEQPGIDQIFRSGLTNGLPVLLPVGVLYDTPENAAALVKWMEARRYPLKQIEVGEEPDGQYIVPEDYGALYIQWAHAIHAVDPRLQVGGPGFQTVLNGWQAWPDATGNVSWMNRFLAYLRRRNCLSDFRFFSFEWYPFDNIGLPTEPQLAQAPALLRNTLAKLRRDGLRRGIPWIITEYGYSSFAGEPEVDLPGALLNAEIVCQFLTLGGRAAYLYGYEPNTLIRETAKKDTWGNLAMFLSDKRRVIRCRLPTYYSAALIAQEWAQPGHDVHRLYLTESDRFNGKGEPLVTAYAVRRPDRRWAILLINKDRSHAYTARIQFETGREHKYAPLLADHWVYGPGQYVWHADDDSGYPLRNNPPAHVNSLDIRNGVTLPAYSMTVIRSDPSPDVGHAGSNRVRR